MTLTPAEQEALGERIESMVVEAFALTQHLAEQSRDTEGNIICCVCGDRATVCVAKGWGGVYACRACAAETEPSQ